MTLRELRLRHYRAGLSCRVLESEHLKGAAAWEARNGGVCRRGRSQARNAARRAEIEEAAVVALNAVVDGPVEIDHERTPQAPQQRRPKSQ